ARPRPSTSCRHPGERYASNAHGLGVRGPCLSGTGFRPKLLPLLCLEHAAWRRASGSPIRAKSTLNVGESPPGLRKLRRTGLVSCLVNVVTYLASYALRAWRCRVGLPFPTSHRQSRSRRTALRRHCEHRGTHGLSVCVRTHLGDLPAGSLS